MLTGPKAEITIARDRDGVPLITASDDDDLAFGLGFAHAQDRLFQMELLRRYGAGRLAEIFGPEALAIDRQMRVLGLYHAAEAEIAYLSPEVRRGLEAYAAGVNAYLATRQGALPPEFLLLRFAPGKWRPADSLVWGKVMALQLEGDYRNELVRARLAATIPAADMAVLYPRYPKDAPTTLSALLPIYRGLALDRLYRALPALVGPHFASDNWVVDGKHSGSGKPLLANDPHLAFGAPGVWYLARLKTPAREIAGATAPGVPLVVIGHNDRIAWGFTTTTSDVEDLFIEKLDPADPGRYLTPRGQRAVRDAAGDDPGQGRGAGRADGARDPPRPGAVRHPAAGQRRPGLCPRPRRHLHHARRPQRRGAVADRPGRRLGELQRRRSKISSGRSRTWFTPMSTARSASSPRAGCRSGRMAMAGCRRRAGPATTTGPASSRSPALPSAANPRIGALLQRQQQDRAR